MERWATAHRELALSLQNRRAVSVESLSDAAIELRDLVKRGHAIGTIAGAQVTPLALPVFQVLPGAAGVREYAATATGIQPLAGAVPEGGVKFYAAYDGKGALKGIAATAGAKAAIEAAGGSVA